ncbi:LysR family transcriptional regulator [Pseudonocardia dioxanivorans]|uniref:LysR family transcriptional regulator n=1 Tax=Pseudonocardia dioxanivorans TaxID=240495 RepID=UPI000CD275D8|nr:LysR family transcriptional regulator [Pseudonocardia dioxanivorans]
MTSAFAATSEAFEGHFGRAAARLYVSAPALSQQVRKLERAVGAELVDRSTHPVRPTEAGARFLAEAREALAAADRAVAAVDRYRRELATTLRIGFMTASAGPQVRGLIDELRREEPEAVVRLVELPWDRQAASVRDGTVDAALVRPPVTDRAGLRFDLVRHEPRVVARPVRHPLAGRGAYRPSVRTMGEQLEVVAAGQAIAITGGFVADSHRHPGVVFVPVSDVEPCALSLCTRTADRSALVAALRQALRAIRPRRDDPAATSRS